jgi:hypothetical protein
LYIHKLQCNSQTGAICGQGTTALKDTRNVHCET